MIDDFGLFRIDLSRLGDREIADEIEFGWRLDRDIAGLRAEFVRIISTRLAAHS